MTPSDREQMRRWFQDLYDRYGTPGGEVSPTPELTDAEYDNIQRWGRRQAKLPLMRCEGRYKDSGKWVDCDAKIHQHPAVDSRWCQICSYLRGK